MHAGGDARRRGSPRPICPNSAHSMIPRRCSCRWWKLPRTCRARSMRARCQTHDGWRLTVNAFRFAMRLRLATLEATACRSARANRAGARGHHGDDVLGTEVVAKSPTNPGAGWPQPEGQARPWPAFHREPRPRLWGWFDSRSAYRTSAEIAAPRSSAGPVRSETSIRVDESRRCGTVLNSLTSGAAG